MKIFAKRTRTVVDAETASRLREEQEVTEKRHGEKAIQELLKLDPRTLNSKQRRMIKRYKERGEPEQNASASHVKNNGTCESEPSKSSDVVNEESFLVSSEAGNVKAACKGSKTQKLGDGVDKQGVEVTLGKNASDEVFVENKPVPENDLQEETVKKLLDCLNSKQRRKLMRRLEREGSSILMEVHNEALRLAIENKADAVPVNNKLDEKQDQGQSVILSSSGEKRKRNWSDLPPEERLRREEQRQKQKEAAERRAKQGNVNNKRHPLNSERRRANRRKPKWERKQLVEKEHKMSGFHMRKIAKA